MLFYFVHLLAQILICIYHAINFAVQAAVIHQQKTAAKAETAAIINTIYNKVCSVICVTPKKLCLYLFYHVWQNSTSELRDFEVFDRVRIIDKNQFFNNFYNINAIIVSKFV